uniref:Uncharacterized protein n=1 Tax=viral metagenome TaxID=1070528 RepID=A0A6C0J389_9ZZZZ
MENDEQINENLNNFNCILFPLTKYFYKVGKDRWIEPYNQDEGIGYCGPPDRCCIDCYLCCTPVCFVLDIISLCSFQCIKS